MSTIGAVGATTPSGTNASTSTTGTTQTLGQDAFLKLLVTQMQQQDPTQPMDNTQFISQMAQFSSLQEMQTMNTSMNTFISDAQFSQLNGLMGKTVTGTQPGQNTAVTGVVTGLQISNGLMYLQVNNQLIDPASITTVSSGQ